MKQLGVGIIRSKRMRNIDLNELYGGDWQWVEEDSLFGVKYRGADLDVKPLREHLEYWSKVPTDPQKLSFGCLNKENKKAIAFMNDILEGRVTTLGNDDGVIKFEYDHCSQDDEDEENWCNEEDYIIFKPLELIREKIRDEAREQGIKPPKTWYRDKVDSDAHRALNPTDELPF